MGRALGVEDRVLVGSGWIPKGLRPQTVTASHVIKQESKLTVEIGTAKCKLLVRRLQLYTNCTPEHNF